MAKLERTYNVPLRKGFQKAPRYKKAKKAVKTLKEFLARHMKVDIKDVKIGPVINKKIWERGIRKPPHHVKVTAVKEDDIVKAELFGHKYEALKLETEEKKEEKKTKEKDIKELEKEFDEVVKKPKEKKETKKPAKKKTVEKETKAKPKKAPVKKKDKAKKAVKKKLAKKTTSKKKSAKKKTVKKSKK